MRYNDDVMRGFSLTDLDNQVLCILLAGDDPILDIFRVQHKYATMKKREMTGVGFFTDLSIPPDVERLTGSSRRYLGDVVAQHPALEGGVTYRVYYLALLPG